MRRPLVLRAALAATLAATLVASCHRSAPPPRKHVLLLTVDTLRPDYLSSAGYPLPTTPYLDELLARGTTFERAITTVPRTTPALASLLTGCYPHSTGVRGLVDTLDAGVPTLAQLAKDRGYATIAVVSNHLLEPERRLDRGFDVYDFAGDVRDAVATTSAALEHAGEIDPETPLLLWVHYIDPHVPYYPPAELARAFDPDYDGRYALHFGDEPGGTAHRAYPADLPKIDAVYRNELPDEVNAHIRRLYAADVRHTDDSVRTLMSGLEARFGPDWTVVFTSDHGESLGEHDYFYDHGDYVYDAGLRVPLAFVFPPGDALAGPARSTAWVSLVDVLPTLIDVLELAPAGGALPVEGRSLRPLIEDPSGATFASGPVFAECGKGFLQLARRRKRFDVAGRFRTVIDGDWKLIWTPGQTPDLEFELYDLVHDPGETDDRYRPDHPAFGALRSALFDWVRTGTAEARDPTDAEKALLRKLGYLDSEEDEGR